MTDWTLFARFAGPVFGVVVGWALHRYFEKKPVVITYLWHASAVSVRLKEGGEVGVHGHSFVVMNVGNVAAKNVRLGHLTLPDFSVHPPTPYEIVDLPGGTKEILFPVLIPKEQITVAYFYFPPTLWSDVNTYTKSDEGYATGHNVFPSRQYPAWVSRAAQMLVLVGIVSMLTAATELGLFLLRHFQCCEVP